MPTCWETVKMTCATKSRHERLATTLSGYH
jgi:hypothetical protein